VLSKENYEVIFTSPNT